MAKAKVSDLFSEEKHAQKEIVMMSVEDIIPYEKNPRNNDDAVEKVANSIREFGFRSPIIVDKDMVIIAGHTRLKASKQLGLTQVPVIVADDLTDEQARAYRLADNKVGELAGWDFALLDAELENIAEGGLYDMDDFGFKELEEVDIDSFFEPSESKPAEEEIEEKPVICPHCGKEFYL